MATLIISTVEKVTFFNLSFIEDLLVVELLSSDFILYLYLSYLTVLFNISLSKSFSDNLFGIFNLLIIMLFLRQCFKQDFDSDKNLLDILIDIGILFIMAPVPDPRDPPGDQDGRRRLSERRPAPASRPQGKNPPPGGDGGQETRRDRAIPEHRRTVQRMVRRL